MKVPNETDSAVHTPIPGVCSVRKTTVSDADRVIRDEILEDLKDCECFEYSITTQRLMKLNGAAAYVPDLNCLFRTGTMYWLDPESAEYEPDFALTVTCPDIDSPLEWSGFTRGGILDAVTERIESTRKTTRENPCDMTAIVFLDGPTSGIE